MRLGLELRCIPVFYSWPLLSHVLTEILNVRICNRAELRGPIAIRVRNHISHRVVVSAVVPTSRSVTLILNYETTRDIGTLLVVYLYHRVIYSRYELRCILARQIWIRLRLVARIGLHSVSVILLYRAQRVLLVVHLTDHQLLVLYLPRSPISLIEGFPLIRLVIGIPLIVYLLLYAHLSLCLFWILRLICDYLLIWLPRPSHDLRLLNNSMGGLLVRTLRQPLIARMVMSRWMLVAHDKLLWRINRVPDPTRWLWSGSLSQSNSLVGPHDKVRERLSRGITRIVEIVGITEGIGCLWHSRLLLVVQQPFALVRKLMMWLHAW